MFNTAMHLNDFLKLNKEKLKLSSSHISLFLAILIRYEEEGMVNPFRINRRQLMKLSCIQSFATYHKKLNELIKIGCISYFPSYDPISASKIEIKHVESNLL